MIQFFLVLLAAYLLGSIPTAVWLSKKVYGFDIRTKGSLNAGLTNIYRVLGWKASVPVAVVDLGKGMLATWLGMRSGAATDAQLWGVLAGVTAILGHSFTVFAGFKGGKGVLTALGMFLFLVPYSAVTAFVLWVIVLKVWGYVSLASISAALVIAPLTFLEIQIYNGSNFLFFVTLLLSAFIIFRHKGNIQRLLNGTENRFGQKHKSSSASHQNTQPEHQMVGEEK